MHRLQQTSAHIWSCGNNHEVEVRWKQTLGFSFALWKLVEFRIWFVSFDKIFRILWGIINDIGIESQLQTSMETRSVV